MITKFVLIIVFAHGYGPRTDYANVGEFFTVEACRAAAVAIEKEHQALDLAGDSRSTRYVCASKG